jgi:hypothetical protein
MPGSCFCEAIREGSIRQPVNTASGVAFLPVAAAMFITASKRRRRLRGTAAPAPPIAPVTPVLVRAVYAGMFAAATLLTGLGTVFFHASLSFWGQTADVLGMYLIASFLVLYNCARLWSIRERIAAPLYLGANAALLWGLVTVPEARRYVFALLVLMAVGLELAVRSRRAVHARSGYFWGALGLLALGFSAWVLDITHTLCRPAGVVQGHAVWHLCSAAALGSIFMYYLSESSTADAAS